MKPGDYSEDYASVLKYLLENDENVIIEAAGQANWKASLGVARAVVGGQNPTTLSIDQKRHYDNVLSPLMHMQCEGLFEVECTQQLTPEEVISGYMDVDNGFLCGSCRHDAGNIDAG